MRRPLVLASVVAAIGASFATGYLRGRQWLAIDLLATLRDDPAREGLASRFEAAVEGLPEDEVENFEQCFHQHGLQPPTSLLREEEQPWATHEDPARDRMASTALIEAAVDARPGMRIADVGAGAGYFTFRLAQAVGARGRVWATDTNPEMVVRISRAARERGLRRVHPVLVHDDQVGLPDGLDRILMVNVYLFDDCRTDWNNEMLGRFASRLRPGGRLVVYEDFGQDRGRGCDSLELRELVETASPWFEVARTEPSPFAPPPGRTPGFLAVLERTPDRAPVSPQAATER